MKKITFVIAAFISTTAAFAQSNTATVNSNSSANKQVSANRQGAQANGDAQSSTTVSVSTEGGQQAASEAGSKAQEKGNKLRAKAKEARNQTENRGQATAESAQNTSVSVAASAQARGEAVRESAQTNADVASETVVRTGAFATTEAREKAAKPAKEKAETTREQNTPQERPANHGSVVSEAAHTFEATATTTNKGQVISEIASVNSEANAHGAARGSVERPAQEQGNGTQTKEARKEARRTKEASANVVTETTQSTDAKVNAHGQAVKEVATSKRQEGASRVDGNVVSETSTRVGGAVRAVPASRPQVGAGRPQGGAGRPAKVINVGGGAAKPVHIDAGVKAGTSIRLGN